MRCVRLHAVGDIRFEEVPEPGPAAGAAVRVRVTAAGICGSDLHNFQTGAWIARLPVIPGHEFCGRVESVGPEVAGLAPGDKVVADSRVFCGDCAPCRDGRPNLCANMGYVGEVCDGGFAELVVLREDQLLRLPDQETPDAVAALSEPLAVAAHVLQRLAPEPGRPILVAGGGPVGGLTAVLLSERGFGPVYLAEKNPDRQALVCEVAGAKPASLDDPSDTDFAYAVEATGSGPVLSRLLEIVAPGARIAMVGLFHGPSPVDLNRIVEREIQLLGCAVYRDEQRAVLDLLPLMADKLRRLVSAPTKLADLPGTFGDLIAGRTTAIKTIVDPGQS